MNRPDPHNLVAQADQRDVGPANGPRTLEEYRRAGGIEPDLCYVVGEAVGFPVGLYELDEGGGAEFQVMRWDDAPGAGAEFWDWYLSEREQFHPSPAAAASTFVAGHREWCRAGARGAASRPA